MEIQAHPSSIAQQASWLAEPVCEERGGIDYLDGKRARVKGVVLNIAYRHPDTDWSVMTVQAGTRRLKVVGHSAAQEGQMVVAEGVLQQRQPTQGWKNQLTLELKAERIVATFPRSPKGIAAFLAANVRGVGPVLAQRIAKTFGSDLPRVLQDEPQQLSRIKGVSEALAQRIAQGWAEQQAVADIMLFLHDQDLSAALCRRIYRTYGEQAKEVLRHNPYRLAQEVRGIGFLKADAIARKLAISMRSPFRIQAGLVHALEQASLAGHCGLPQDDLCEQAAQALQVDEQLVRQQLHELLAQPKAHIVQIGSMVWLRKLQQAEADIARTLKRMAQRRPAWHKAIGDVQQALQQAQQRLGLQLADKQAHAVRMALSSQVSIITGGPGCGKTTTLNVILDILRRAKVRYCLAAPTGKAAARAAQAT
ncbi:MAG: AAA family ATPase, partial [Rhodocyclaceae bacterium]|nr:AAA family ATPase [Rhodocyclaceae bacterium]